MQTDSYARAARAKHRNPQHRDDARAIAQMVHADPAGGLRRDQLAADFSTILGWPFTRFQRALFTAYGLHWIDFCGWSYIVAPGPGISTSNGHSTASTGTPSTGPSHGGPNHNSSSHPPSSPAAIDHSTAATNRSSPRVKPSQRTTAGPLDRTHEQGRL